MWKKGAKLAAYTVVGLACAFFIKQLWEHHAEIPAIEWSGETVLAGVFSLFGTLATVGLIALIWKLLLNDQGVSLAYAQSLRIIAITQIGKYLPGNVGHFAGRAILAQKAGIPTGKTLTTIGIETAWTLAISASFSVAALLFFTQQAQLSDTLQLQPWHLLAAGIFLLFLPFVGIRLLNLWLPGISLKLGHGSKVQPPTLLTALMVSALMMVCYFILGAVLKLQALHIFGSSAGGWIQLTMLFTTAWVVGYMLPGAPGGLGVREAMMLALLGPVLGTTVALGVSVTMRLTSMAGDGLAFLMGWLISPKTP